ncbi:MAG: ribulose-phosphate 3-epimerase [Bacteriovoracaceae bacterium]|jgi:ribulose-phosphate 3-epimerase|nr:ribulose-phosphate 3-epimerase [Halobacteriovoraceae bacterium]MDP7321877.1 ribulose-phosphate 3-epimerase [Bacteriovoracaceae bacterium]
MTIIAPSLLSANFLSLQEEIQRFDGVKDLWLHLDVMDGHFVPNLTFGQTVLKEIHRITTHKLDAHLMVTNPENYIEPFKSLNLYNFTFHWEASIHQDRLIQELKKHYPSVGISLNPATPIEVIPEYIFKQIDLILIMTVNPGFGGQSFISGCMDKITKLQALKEKHDLNFHIQVDGGVNQQNAKSLKHAGATNLVAGSYIFKEPNKNYAAQVSSLRE